MSHAKRLVAPTASLNAAWTQVAALAAALDASLGKWLSDTRGTGLTDYRALAHLHAVSSLKGAHSK